MYRCSNKDGGTTSFHSFLPFLNLLVVYLCGRQLTNYIKDGMNVFLICWISSEAERVPCKH